MDTEKIIKQAEMQEQNRQKFWRVSRMLLIAFAGYYTGTKLFGSSDELDQKNMFNTQLSAYFAKASEVELLLMNSKKFANLMKSSKTLNILAFQKMRFQVSEIFQEESRTKVKIFAEVPDLSRVSMLATFAIATDIAKKKAQNVDVESAIAENVRKDINSGNFNTESYVLNVLVNKENGFWVIDSKSLFQKLDELVYVN